MNKLNKLFDFLEENIDLNHEKEKENLYLNTLDYKKVPFLPLQISYPLGEDIRLYNYQETFNEPKKMLYNELTLGMGSVLGVNSVYNSVKLKDHFPLQIRSNHGIGLIASLFGVESKALDNNMPWVDSYKDIKEVKKLVEKGMPELSSSLFKKVIENYQYFNHKLKQYPKCYQTIKITQPDLQGPFDIAHLLCGSNIFLYLYDYPDIIHGLLDLITNCYIRVVEYFDNLNLLTGKIGKDSIYVHGAIYKGSVIIKDDTAIVNLSENMYREFAAQYNERIVKAFGKGSFHYCGQNLDWHIKNIIKQKVSSVNYGNPELQNLNDIYESFKQHNISVVMWGLGQHYDFVKDYYKKGISTGITLSVKSDSYKDARKIMKEYTN
jgi:hypothetical protein